MRLLTALLGTALVCLAGAAQRALKASSLVPCMDHSQLSATTFEVTFDPDQKSLSYNLDLDSGIDGYVTAKAEVYAYGFPIITKTIDLCSLSFKQFCPLYAGPVMVDSKEQISADYVSMIPGIAYTVPDIDAYVKIRVFSQNGTNLACMAAYFTNGKTVSHAGAKWATAVVAGAGLLASALLSAFGNSNAASHISVNSVALFTYFQSVVISAMTHVESVPPIASAWAENLAWSMGLIRVPFMQSIFRWYIQATGGHPSLYFVYAKKAVLVQRAIVAYLAKRAPALVVNSSDKLTVLRGIKRIGYNAHIEVTSIVVTGFTFFVLCGYVLAALVLLAKLLLEALVRLRLVKNPSLALSFRANYKTVLKGALLRYISIGFPQLTIFSLWEFTQNDSPAVVILAILFLLLAVGISGWAAYRAYYFGKTSVLTYHNPAAILYGNQRVLDKYGFSYTMYNANMYWWGGAFMLFSLVKAVFVGLCQSSGKTQSLVIFILDAAYLAAVIRYRPFLDKPTNILQIIIASVVCLNSFLFVFFSGLFHQPGVVSSIMGWVFFIVNAAFSLILLVIILVYTATALFSKNPDARFRRAGDDRASFQKSSAVAGDEKPFNSVSGARSISNPQYLNSPNPGAEELLDLGFAAKNHQSNWEDEIYRLKDMVNSKGDLLDDQEALELKSKSTIDKLRNVDNSGSSQDDVLHHQGTGASGGLGAAAATLGTKLVHSLSMKRNKSQKRSQTISPTKENPVASLSRTLSAMKMSRNNSQKLRKQANVYGAVPTTNPDSPNPNIGAFSANTTHPLPALNNNSSSSNNLLLQRTTSQTPMNSPTDDFQFADASTSADYSNYNYNAFNQPATTTDILGSANTTMDSNQHLLYPGNNSQGPVSSSSLDGAADHSHDNINGVSLGRKF